MLIGVDVGGTFTDAIALDRATGRVRSAKTPTVHGALVVGILDAIDALEAGRADRIVHGSTIATNALIEGTTATTGFIGTKGFTDELDIQRMVRRWSATEWSAVYDLHQEKPPPVVPRRLRREVDERIAYPGVVVQELDDDELRTRARELVDEGAEALAVCFLWSPANDVHERRAADVLRAAFPDRPVSVSAEVAPIVREYERMVTTAVNASLLPVVGDYLRMLELRLAEKGFRGRLLVMQSSGGVARPETVAARPVTTLRGGPVGGAVAARWLARSLGLQHVLACDVGGTSTDTTLILDQTVPLTDELEVNYHQLRIASADIRAIGAGGGSVAAVDAGGALRVGPESVGSFPGPACYRRGGTLPTLTDANLLLGRLGPHAGLALDAAAARAAFAPLAEGLGRDVLRAAYAVVRVAVANMADSVRLQTVDRGHDPRELTLVAFGGAGPLHATLLAAASAIPQVVIPLEPGVFSSLGMVVAEQSVSTQLAYLTPLAAADADELRRRYEALEDEARALLGAEVRDVSVARAAAMRYLLQEWEIRVDTTGSGDAAELARRFHDAHRARYGFAREDKPVELVTLYVDASVPAAQPVYGGIGAGDEDASAARTGTRRVYVDDEHGAVDVPVYARTSLMSGNRLAGPFVVEEPTSTTYVQPGWAAVVDTQGNLSLSR